MVMDGGVFASISAPQLKPLFGRRHTLVKSCPSLLAAYDGRHRALLSTTPKPRSGFTNGLSLKLIRGKGRGLNEIKCVKATPLEVSKWAAMAAISIWATKFIVSMVLEIREDRFFILLEELTILYREEVKNAYFWPHVKKQLNEQDLKFQNEYMKIRI
ncbi:hypothetical protein SUGI_0326490 [Cryptomeria japonica]|nr:hypothetical protein SUGI_0326490 [Cryptomeria japonica]